MKSIVNEIPVDAMGMAAGLHSGAFSARECVQAGMERIEALNPQVNAFTLMCFDRAMREAASVDAQRAKGQALSPLAGVPYAVKNLFDIEGEITIAGSKVLAAHAPVRSDAFLVDRMQQSGAILMGALNMDEFAYGFTTENSHAGACRNPHDLSRIAGGSSGGSGAAVAAGLVPITLGSDTNGSIRVPSSLCGVWGLKPTFGRLSRRGSYPFVHSIDHLGPMADSVQALTLAYDALQSPDAQDPGCHARAIEPVMPELNEGIQGLRIGVLGGYFEGHSTSVAREAVQAAARALNATADVAWPDAALARAAAFIITASEGGSLHLEHLRNQMDAMEPLSVDRFIAGALQPVAWYLRAQRFRRVYRDRVNRLFEDWDVLLAPATPVTAPVIGTEWIDINGQQHPCRPAMGLLTQPISFAGCPVVAAPMWMESAGSLPIGMQIIAAPWREDLALRAARALEREGVAVFKLAGL